MYIYKYIRCKTCKYPHKYQFKGPNQFKLCSHTVGYTKNGLIQIH